MALFHRGFARRSGSSHLQPRCRRVRRLSYEECEGRIMMAGNSLAEYVAAHAGSVGLIGPYQAGVDVYPAITPCASLTAFRPQEKSGSYAPFSKTAVSEQDEENASRGPGIRINGDDDNLNGKADRLDTTVSKEDDLIEVTLQATGVNYVLQRADANLCVWRSATKGVGNEIVFTNNQSAPLTSSAGSSTQQTVWVEWVGAGQGNSNLTLKPKSGTGPQDTLAFHTFHSIAIVIGGEKFADKSPPNPSTSVWQIGTRLYGEGYDVRLHNEDDAPKDGAGAAYNEVYNAIHNEGVTQVAILGYSHGGGSTYYLANRLKNDGSKIGTFSIAFTAYVDAIQNSWDGDMKPEDRRPPGSVYHMDYYRGKPTPGEFLQLHGCATNPKLAGDFALDVQTTTWGKNATHSSANRIDELAQVVTGIHDGFVKRVAV